MSAIHGNLLLPTLMVQDVRVNTVAAASSKMCVAENF
jgi:hypothetical protein